MIRLIDLLKVIESCDSVVIVYSRSSDVYCYKPSEIDEFISKYENNPEFVTVIHAIDEYRFLIVVDL